MIAEPRKGGTEPGLSAGFPFDFWPFLAVDRNRPAPLLLSLTRGGRGYWGQVPRLTRGHTFFLRRQEESSQRRRRPWVGACYAGSLRYSVLAGAAELGATPLGQSSPFPASPCVARHLSRGPKSVAARWSYRNSCLLRSTVKKGQKSISRVAYLCDEIRSLQSVLLLAFEVKPDEVKGEKDTWKCKQNACRKQSHRTN